MDLTQTIFLAVLRALPGFDSRKASFRTWLYRIAVHKAVDGRRKARGDIVPLEDRETPDTADFAAQVQDRDLLDRLEGYVSCLDPDTQAVYRLRLYGERTFPEIAAALQLLSPAPALFLSSPLLYALLLGLTAWKEAQSGLLDWKRSCRLSLQAVAALRMVVFGGGSVLVCVPVNLWLWRARGGELPLSWMLGVSLSSLFLYGLLSLVCLERRGRGRLAAPPVIWAALGGGLLVWDGASAWLTALPGAVFLALAGAALALYLLELRRFCLGQRRGESYAVS